MSRRTERLERAGVDLATRDIALLDGYAYNTAVSKRLAECFVHGPIGRHPRRTRTAYRQTLHRELWARAGKAVMPGGLLR